MFTPSKLNTTGYPMDEPYSKACLNAAGVFHSPQEKTIILVLTMEPP